MSSNDISILRYFFYSLSVSGAQLRFFRKCEYVVLHMRCLRRHQLCWIASCYLLTSKCVSCFDWTQIWISTRFWKRFKAMFIIIHTTQHFFWKLRLFYTLFVFPQHHLYCLLTTLCTLSFEMYLTNNNNSVNADTQGRSCFNQI